MTAIDAQREKMYLALGLSLHKTFLGSTGLG